MEQGELQLDCFEYYTTRTRWQYLPCHYFFYFSILVYTFTDYYVYVHRLPFRDLGHRGQIKIKKDGGYNDKEQGAQSLLKFSHYPRWPPACSTRFSQIY